VREEIKEILQTSFSSTLARETDIVNIIMSLIYTESSFKPRRGITYPKSHINKVISWSAIKNKYNMGTAEERGNITDSIAAFGLAQVTGYYVTKGASPGGQSEIQRLRPDLAAPLILDPGMNVSTILLGNTRNQILAGLIVLEGKYRSIYVDNLVKKGIFNNRLTAAVSAYLGIIGASDGLGMTPERYANKIIRGSSYQIANNGMSAEGVSLAATGDTVTPNSIYPGGPIKTKASGTKLSFPDC
jgi:hypothetical protein